MNKVIGVEHPYIYQTYFVKTNQPYKSGEYVVIDLGKGEYLYKVTHASQPENPQAQDIKDIKSIRKPSKFDLDAAVKNQEKIAFFDNHFKSVAKELAMPFDYLGTMISLDGTNVKFIYFASERIDFREFIQKLLKKLKTRIKVEMFQVGDRAFFANYGGLGSCGYELCCKSQKYSTPAITTNSIKHLGFKKELKINFSGLCGKYKCCLLYEVEMLKEYIELLPDLQTELIINDARFRVTEIDLYRYKIVLERIRSEAEIAELLAAEIEKETRPLKRGKSTKFQAQNRSNVELSNELIRSREYIISEYEDAEKLELQFENMLSMIEEGVVSYASNSQFN